jgi:hypothetical protein
VVFSTVIFDVLDSLLVLLALFQPISIPWHLLRVWSVLKFCSYFILLTHLRLNSCSLYMNRIKQNYKMLPGAGVAHSVQCLTTYWTTRVCSLAEAKDFSCSLCVQTSSEATQLLTSGYRKYYPGSKAQPGRATNHSPHLVPRSGAHPASCTMCTGGREWVGAIPPLPPSSSMACSGTALPFFNFYPFGACMVVAGPLYFTL